MHALWCPVLHTARWMLAVLLWYSVWTRSLLGSGTGDVALPWHRRTAPGNGDSSSDGGDGDDDDDESLYTQDVSSMVQPAQQTRVRTVLHGTDVCALLLVAVVATDDIVDGSATCAFTWDNTLHDVASDALSAAAIALSIAAHVQSLAVTRRLPQWVEYAAQRASVTRLLLTAALGLMVHVLLLAHKPHHVGGHAAAVAIVVAAATLHSRMRYMHRITPVRRRVLLIAQTSWAWVPPPSSALTALSESVLMPGARPRPGVLWMIFALLYAAVIVGVAYSAPPVRCNAAVNRSDARIWFGRRPTETNAPTLVSVATHGATLRSVWQPTQARVTQQAPSTAALTTAASLPLLTPQPQLQPLANRTIIATRQGRRRRHRAGGEYA